MLFIFSFLQPFGAHMLTIFGAKDRGAANVTSLVARTAQKRGHGVMAFAEDPATAIFEDARINYVTSDLSLASVEDVLLRRRPDYIITGMSFPQSPVEEYLRSSAKRHGIPLILIEDVPGASRRTGHTADYVFTTDEIGLVASQTHHPDAQCFIAGNIGVKPVIPSQEMLKTISALQAKYDKIYMFTESTKPGHGSIDEQIELLIECAQQTSGSLCIIPRLHPKWQKTMDGGVSLQDRWMEKLQEGIPNLVLMSHGTTDELAMLADGVISVFSTLLATAAYHHRVAISLRTPLSVEFMQEATGFETAHIVQLGCATEVSGPCDLSTIEPASEKDREKLHPFNPELVCDTLERTLGR